MSKTFKLDNSQLEVVIGKYAGQADGAAWLQHGNNRVLCVATATKEAKDFMGFFPLTVEYREKTAAAGRFPGGFIKREGRLSDKEVLTCRVIDRSIRPFFPSDYFNEVQVLASVYSSDGEHPVNAMALIGASIALNTSSIPFAEPIGAVTVGRVDGELSFNINLEQEKESDVDILVAGTESGICMVEGNCDLMTDDEMVDLLFKAHEEIKRQIEWQKAIVAEVGKEKITPESKTDWAGWSAKVAEWFKGNNAPEAMFAPTKEEQNARLKEKKKAFKEHFAEAMEADEGMSSSILSYLFDKELKNHLPDLIVQKGHRFDGRDHDTVRPISVEVGMLPQAHGSATFRRGATEVMSSITLGTAQDAQKYEHLIEGQKERNFMVHYNFPPFAVGEVRPIRSVGRREIGHGYLAENSVKSALPDYDGFPYTIRSVADVLECNGSSSMATVCATTMGLLDAGVPMKEMVSGVAMGLIQDSTGKFHVLTDILGSEDALGLMDFKVTGSDKGIRAIQMDIKAKEGLSRELMRDALTKARTARTHIMGEMQKVMDKPRETVSKLAPKIISIQIDPDKIGAVIGPSGKVIKEIVAQTDAQIDIDNDGIVRIYSKDQEAGIVAEQWVRVLAGDIKVGAVFNGIIRRFAEFGLFVELVPGKDGLLHISQIDKKLQDTLQDKYQVGDPLPVKVMAYEKDSGRVKLMAPSLAPNRD
ncbi:MAG: polyribonucleotide nucleotidyltransferase [Candidatus Dependentiae bacterium]|jgi:polyribonucleotide nucleotidyltransferase